MPKNSYCDINSHFFVGADVRRPFSPQNLLVFASPLSLTPCFSKVLSDCGVAGNRFQRFSPSEKLPRPGTLAQNGPNHPCRCRRPLFGAGFGRARRCALIIASNSSWVVSRFQAPAWSFSRLPTLLMRRRLSHCAKASPTTSSEDGNSPEATSRKTASNCSWLKLMRNVPIDMLNHSPLFSGIE